MKMSKEEKFDVFWKLYPRKVAKVSELRSWKRLTKKENTALEKRSF